MPLPSPPVALANYSQLIARRLGSLRRRPSALASRQTTHARPQHARLPLSRQRARVPRRPEEARAMEEARAKEIVRAMEEPRAMVVARTMEESGAMVVARTMDCL